MGKWMWREGKGGENWYSKGIGSSGIGRMVGGRLWMDLVMVC